MLKSIVFAFICGSFLAACATTKHVSVNGDDERHDGIRYYETSPFLLIKTDNAGGVVSSIEYWPDRNKLRSVSISSFLASNNTTLDFENGVLIQSNTVADETVVPKAALSAVTEIFKANFSTRGADEAPAIYVFRIHFENNGQIAFEADCGMGNSRFCNPMMIKVAG